MWESKIRHEDHWLASWGLPSFILKKSLKKPSRKSWIRWDATWWPNFNITMTSWISVRPASGCLFVLYFSLGLVRVCEINRFSGDRKIRNHWTPMIDSFSHLPRPYGTVLCNICWWRHRGRCKESMTRAVQINLKQRINSALDNKQMVNSSKWINRN